MKLLSFSFLFNISVSIAFEMDIYRYIKVKTEKETLYLTVNLGDTQNMIKQQISCLLGVPPQNLSLYKYNEVCLS